jgi:fructoselysine-6-P-deglycase FrlB-like protein
MSIVEETLRSQREAWREISSRVAEFSDRVLPNEVPRRILFFGLGSSHFAARLVALSLMRDKSRSRIPVIACSSTSIGHEVFPSKGDWAFALTHRGASAVTLQALSLCEQYGAFTVGICAKEVQDLASAHTLIHTSAIEKVEPHTVAVSGAICAATTLLMGAKAAEEWDALCSLGDPDLDLLRQKAARGPTILLGEWEGEWLAREGALKLMEMAKCPVRAFSSEEFFHGPKLCLQPDDQIWHISLPKDPRAYEIKAAHPIYVSGASPLAWVPALVELQWLALAVALNRGADPDQ